MPGEQLDFNRDAIVECEGQQAAEHAVSKPRRESHCAIAEQVTATHPHHSSIPANFNFANSQQNASTFLEKILQLSVPPRSMSKSA